jgi:UDP-GlcNAc:undecaprenyl-phosphate/decaprenyl-phosphate GlcNAc-1-phosphate transferase
VTFIPAAAGDLPLLVVYLLVAAAVSFALTPAIRQIAIRFDAIDRPNQRRVNTSPVPRGGGIAVVVAFVAVSLVALGVNAVSGSLPIPPTVQSTDLVGLFLGGIAAAAFGVIDDALDLRARWQFLGQLALAVFAIVLGITVDFITSPFGRISFDGIVAIAFTILWIAGMINAINFIDGLDGLSSGIGFIAALTLGLISLTPQVAGGQPFISLLCFVLAGALLGFLRWNFHPASIFVGTSGVMFLGYTLAVLSILGTAKVAVALLILGVPIIDAFWIIVRRLAEGRSPFSPDRGHLHHRLLDIGLSHRQTVLLIYAICVGLGLLAMLLSGSTQLYAFVGAFAVLGFVVFILARGGFATDEVNLGD